MRRKRDVDAGRGDWRSFPVSFSRGLWTDSLREGARARLLRFRWRPFSRIHMVFIGEPLNLAARLMGEAKVGKPGTDQALDEHNQRLSGDPSLICRCVKVREE